MIDTHAHVYLCKQPIDELLANATAAGVTHMVVPGLDVPTSLKTLELSQKFPHLVPTMGIHPSDAAKPYNIDEIRGLVKKHPFKAIGEVGLDYYKQFAPREDQHRLFTDMLELAKDNHLPVILHSRNADSDMIEFHRRYPDLKKVFHCFSSDLEFAKTVINDHTYFSFTGIITYAESPFAEVLRYLPKEKIMIETDCPYLTPVPHRGKENQPAYLVETAKRIAEIRSVSLEEILNQTTANAKSFFGIA